MGENLSEENVGNVGIEESNRVLIRVFGAAFQVCGFGRLVVVGMQDRLMVWISVRRGADKEA